MQYLHDQGLVIDTINRSSFGELQLDSVKWLIENDMIGDQHDFSYAIAQAALHGRLDILQLFQALDTPWSNEAVGLKRRRTGQAFSLWGGDRDTFYWAAQGGHVHVLEWLQENYPAKCGTDAMNTAAYLGRLEAVKWLHANRTEGCTSNAMYYSAHFGRFEMVKWLYLNRPESHTSEAIVRAIRSGHLRIAYWLARKYPKYSIHCYWFDIADKRLVSSSNSLEVLLFLRAVYPYVFTANFTRLLRNDFSYEKSFTDRIILSWLGDNFSCEEQAEP